MRKIIPVLMSAAIALSGCAATAQPAQQPTTAAVPTMVLPDSAGNAAAAPAPASSGETSASSAPATAPSLDIGITGSGEVQALQSAELGFQIPGVVSEVLIEEGDTVAAGTVLARLVLTDYELQVRQAEAGLAQATANYERLLEGATPEEERAARAQIAQAQAGLASARGSVTDADIAAAQAQVDQARALVARLESGPRTTDLENAQAALAAARSNYEIQRDNLSAGKTNAELRVEQAANQLRDVQAQYDTVYWQNRELEQQLAKFGQDLPREAIDSEDALLRGVRNAEAGLEQARVQYEQARQAEINGLAAAQAQVDQAQAGLDRVLAGADTDQLAGARAQLAGAQANLQRLTGQQRAGQLAGAQAQVSAAQANLDRLLADPSAPTLAGAQAQILQAQTTVDLAKRNLEKATIVAPFAGVISLVGVDPGDAAGAGSPVIRLVDISELRVEVNISDADIARVALDQRAEVRVDGLPGQVFNGAVSFIAPTATVVGNVRTFAVRITLTDSAGLRAGMSARATILP